MGAAIRAHDWSASTLGPIGKWPQSLRTTVQMMLDAKQPVYIAWGAELTSLYNDGYVPILGSKHPGALGRPYPELWPEIWEEYRPIVDATMAGEAPHFVNRPVALQGRVDRPLSWFTFSWTPIRDGGSKVAGFYSAATETSREILEAERDRQRRDAALLASERRYQTLFKSIDEGVYLARAIFDQSGACTDILYLDENPAAVRMVGQPAKGRTLSELGDYEDFWRETFGTVARTGEGRRLEHFAAPVGLWFDFYVFKPPEAAPDELAVIFRDITERKRAEAASRESEARFRQFGESSADVLWIVDADSNQLEYISPAYETVWGAPREPVMADIGEWSRRVHPEDFAKASEGMGILRSGRRYTAEYRIVRPDGDVRYILDTGFPIYENGRVRRLAGIAQDLTDRRIAERKLAESERRMRTLATGIPQLVFRADAAGRRTWNSPQWIEFTGLSFEESLDRGWLDAVHPDDRAGTVASLEEAVDRSDYYHEYRIRHAASGDYRWHQTRATALRDGSGVIEWLGTSTDVEELRRLQSHQQTLLAELQHRVRNTLGIIRSIARRTAATSASVEEMSMHLEGRLGAFSRVQSIVTRQPGAGVGLMTMVEDELRAHAAREGESLRIVGPEISFQPRAAESVSLALHELATNAVKYGALSAADGRIDVEWVRTFRDQGEWLELVWEENGVDQPLSQPDRHGFGMELLTRTLPYDLRAETEFELRPEGLRFTLKLPLGPDIEAA
jgi:PAS domain S-box-containing protein